MKPDEAAGVGDASLSESTVEVVALDRFAALGWAVAHGPDIAPDAPAAERTDYGAVVLNGRLRSALARLNPDVPDDALEDAIRRLMHPAGATLEARNRAFHRMVVVGVTVEYVDTDGRFAASRSASSTSRNPTAMTGLRSTSSPWSRTNTSAGPTLCCSSTGCRSPSSS